MLESWLLFGIVGNVLSTVCCVLGNKYLSTELGFEFMMTLSGIHFLLTAIGTRVIAKVAKVKRTPNPPGVLEILPLCIFTTGSVGLMNLNLLHNSVGFYMLSKLCCIPCTLVLEWYLSKKQTSWAIKGALLIVLTGVGIATVTDVQCNLTGSLFAVAAVLVTALCQISTVHTIKRLGILPLQLLLETSPIQALLYILLAPMFDNWGISASGLAPLAAGTVFSFHYTPAVLLFIFLTSAFGLGVNVTNFFVLAKTSPVTYQVVGHLKTCVILVFGFVFLHQPVVWRNVAGIAVALLGMFVYSYVKLEESSKAEKKA
eukprot:Rmarinus@m.18298